MISQLFTPIRALVVGLSGVGLAWFWFNDLGWLAALLAAAVALLGYGLDAFGRQLLPGRPLLAVRLMDWWVLTPGICAAVGAGVIVIITVALTLPEGTSTQMEELVSALSTGISGFITAAFVSWVGDEKDSQLAEHIRGAFFEKYGGVRPGQEPEPDKHYFPPNSPGERWVFGDEFRGISGWGRQARVRRAKGIEEELLRHSG